MSVIDKVARGQLSAYKAENATQFNGIHIDVRFPPLAPMVAAVWDGIVDDTPAVLGCIQYIQNYGATASLLSDGTNDTRFGGTILFPTGRGKLTGSLIINAIASLGDGAVDASTAGVKLKGAGKTCTILDFTDSLSGSGIIGDASHIAIEDLQILNSPEHGIELTGWMLDIKNVFVNNPVGDGVYFHQAFMVKVADNLVYNAGGYGFSFNDYHTSLDVEHNYALHCTLGGYFAGNRIDMNLSKGITYSSFKANACDASVTAYTFARAKGVTLTGNGCEDVVNALYIYGGNDTSLEIVGLFTHDVSGNVINFIGNNAKVIINNLVDSTPVDIAVPLIGGAGGTNNLITLTAIKTTRTYLVDSNTLVLTKFNDNKSRKSITFDTQGKTIATLKHPTGYNGNYGGQILVRAFTGNDKPATVGNTADYLLHINKGAGGSNIATVSAVGLKGDTTAALSWPSFDFTFVGDTLIATHTTNSAWTSRDFAFIFDPVGDISIA